MRSYVTLRPPITSPRFENSNLSALEAARILGRQSPAKVVIGWRSKKTSFYDCGIKECSMYYAI